MNITHLQLNTSLLNSPDKIVDFIISNNVDLACLQEICYPIDGINPLPPLLKSHGYHAVEGIHFFYLPNNQSLAVNLISRWPILDYHTWYYNTPDYQPKTIKAEDQLFGDLINNNFPNYPASRGLINSLKSRCLISATIQTPSGIVRLISTHFNISDLCVELNSMYDMSLLINSVVKNSASIPTIFSADLNIRSQSYSVAKISEVLTCHTAEFTDTLSSTHRAKKSDFPQGLATDHVFSTGLTHQSTKTVEIDFSEHLALVSQFSL